MYIHISFLIVRVVCFPVGLISRHIYLFINIILSVFLQLDLYEGFFVGVNSQHIFINIYFSFLAVSPRKTSNANEPKSAPPNMKGSSFLNHDHTHAIIYKSDPPVRVSFH